MVELNHVSFEVQDLDDLMTGHEHLREPATRITGASAATSLGSQIYDYWRDPFGNVVEHWTDGDLFNARERDRRRADRRARGPRRTGARRAPSPFGA